MPIFAYHCNANIILHLYHINVKLFDANSKGILSWRSLKLREIGTLGFIGFTLI